MPPRRVILTHVTPDKDRRDEIYLSSRAYETLTDHVTTVCREPHPRWYNWRRHTGAQRQLHATGFVPRGISRCFCIEEIVAALLRH